MAKKSEHEDPSELVTLAERLDRIIGILERREPQKVPLAYVRLTGLLERYSLYLGKHQNQLVHNQPHGLRITLIDDSYILVESPGHEKDAKREVVNFRLPLSSGLVQEMEDLVPFKYRLSPDEHYALVEKAAKRTNYLNEVEPKEEFIRKKVADATQGRRAPQPSTETTPAPKGLSIGAPTNDEQELLDDEMADERAEAEE